MPKPKKAAALPVDQQWTKWREAPVDFQTWAERLSQADTSKEATAQWIELGKSVPFELRKILAEGVLTLLRSWRDGSLIKNAKGAAQHQALTDADKVAAGKAASAESTRTGRMARESAQRLMQWGWMDHGEASTLPDSIIEWYSSPWKGLGTDKTPLSYCIALDERKLLGLWRARNPDFGGAFQAPELDASGRVPGRLLNYVGEMAQKGWVEETLAATSLLLAAQAQAPVSEEQKATTFLQTSEKLWIQMCEKSVNGRYEHVGEIGAAWKKWGLVSQDEARRARLLVSLVQDKQPAEQVQLLSVLKTCGFSAFDRDAENRDLLLSMLVRTLSSHWVSPNLCSVLVDNGADCTQQTTDGLSVFVLAKQLYVRSPTEAVHSLFKKIEQRVSVAQEAKELHSLLDNRQKDHDADLGEQLRSVVSAGLLRTPNGETLSLEAFAALAQQAVAIHAQRATVLAAESPEPIPAPRRSRSRL